MYRVRIKRRLDLIKKLKRIASGDYRFFTPVGAKMIRDDIIKNIHKQITPTGTRLKRNKKSTREQKRRTLGHSKSLIWHRVLIDSSTWITQGQKKKAIVKLKVKRREIGRILEGHGYRFFGISPWVRSAILKRFRSMIRAGLK